MSKIFWLLLWGIGVSANFYFALRWIAGDRFLPVRLANYFLPWIGLALLICLSAALYSKKRKLCMFLLAPVVIVAVIYAPSMLQCRVGAAAEGPTLKVMSYNVWRDNRDMAAATSVIQSKNPDILLLQEVTPVQLNTLVAALNSLGTGKIYNVAHDPANQAAIASRFQIKETNSLPQKNRSQKAYIETPFGPLTVINIHGVRTGWTIRHREVEEMLSEDVLSEQGPVILGGDFNTTDQSQTYHLIKRYLANTHDDAGCGFGFTFPARSHHLGRFSLFGLPFPPLLRIDHIFYSRHFTVLKSCTASDSGGSDHLPVVAELALLDQGGIIKGAVNLDP